MNSTYRVVRVSGPERIPFLQGQLTADVARLDDDPLLLAAWCNPKGRVIVTLRLLALEDAVGLVVPEESVDAVVPRLTMYRLRAKADISVDEDFVVAAYPAATVADALAACGALPDERPLAAAGGADLLALRLDGTIELAAPLSALQAAGIGPDAAVDAEAHARARIAAGLAEIKAATSERFTPHMLNLDLAGAISFSKGCYTGQEVVARTENLGRVKRRINLYRIDDGRVDPGDRLSDGQDSVGEVVNAASDLCLAIVPVERHRERLRAGEAAASPLPLPYA